MHVTIKRRIFVPDIRHKCFLRRHYNLEKSQDYFDYLTFFIGFQQLLGGSAQVLKSGERKHLDYSIASINHPQSHLKEKTSSDAD